MDEFTSKIKTILDTSDDQVNIAEAALLLLKLNRNRILHDSIVRKNNVGKLKYELKKIYDFRMKDNALAETKELENAAVVIVKETLPKAEAIEATETKGKRADHDRLPDEIKALLLENQNVFPRMRKLHEQLKLMANSKPCDRYPFLKELKELDETLRNNWEIYDTHIILSPVVETPPVIETPVVEAPPVVDVPPIVEAPPVDMKKISAARKYLSDNKTKLKDLKESEDNAKYQALLVKMQERLNLLIDAKAGVSEDYINELKELGLNA